MLRSYELCDVAHDFRANLVSRKYFEFRKDTAEKLLCFSSALRYTWIETKLINYVDNGVQVLLSGLRRIL